MFSFPLSIFFNEKKIASPTIVSYSNPNYYISNGTYINGSYSPNNDRIYFAPYNIHTSNTYLHYIECDTSTLVQYTKNPSIVNNSAYQGSVYCPNQNRIYFVPAMQGWQSNLDWHYIDCASGIMQSYPNPGGCVANNVRNYYGGAYCTNQKRIYFAPYDKKQDNNPIYHYIDCSDPNPGDNNVTVGTYSVNLSEFQINAYTGAVYVESEEKIYFLPYNQASSALWHYIDCSDATPLPNVASIVSYPNTEQSNISSSGYSGGCYVPIQNRIYLAPNAQISNANGLLHYINTLNNSIVSYNMPIGAFNQSNTLIYSPSTKNIYFLHKNTFDTTNWIYFNASQVNPVSIEYLNYISPYISNIGFLGGIYSPLNDRIYLAPYTQGAQYSGDWYYINC